ncbi:WXG100 family type VII secretion target [Kitasatospora kifunensis]|uniref:Uncharacterized protein YukE n=1 Tax=Kitasatospora kifunensis TaxID=58351 RepID=A0A7W7VUG7_KITKI|nr:WXG100 family type VII secretion target [Kitasatospora kifunensis]MBB4922634.1 uncharacterized protein YukE [Kitasatospora kifunensis]
MAGGQFQVHPAALTALGGRFGTESQTLAGQVASFETTASDVGQAFGLLGACDGAASQYLQLFNSTSKALNQLTQVLDANNSRLQTSAATYQATDKAVSGNVNNVGKSV